MADADFILAQREFARHLRDPRNTPAPPGLPAERVAVYRHAVRHNIAQFMHDNFPRVRDALSEAAWNVLLDEYLREHAAYTPVFSRLPGEFLAFLEARGTAPGLPDYLQEIAHFDWLENDVGCDEAALPQAGIDATGDLLDGHIVVNPVHRLVTYRYPVHAVNAEYRPETPPAQATHLVAFRDREHQFGVLDLNPVAHDLFQRVRAAPERGARAALLALAQALGHTDPARVMEGGLAILERMRSRELLLGTRG